MALALSALLMLGAAPAIQTVLTGQVDLLVLLPLALVPELTRRGHERWVGALLAAAALLKLTPLLLLGYLALRRRWRALGAALVTLTAVSLLCLLIVGPGTLLAALPQALHTGTGDSASVTTRRCWPHCCPPTHRSPRGWQMARGCYAGAGAGARLSPVALDRAREGSRSEMLVYGVTLCALLLLAPAAWVHHYVWRCPRRAGPRPR